MNSIQIFLILVSSILLFDMTTYARVVIEPIKHELSSGMKAEEALFKKSFKHAYKKVPEILQSVGDLDHFLTAAFADEIKDFTAKKSGTYFFRAIDSGSKQVVGFVGFDVKTKEKSAYIRQLAVDPKYQKSGVGRQLVFALLQGSDLELDHMEMVTRKANIEAFNFYRKLGFIESPFQHEGLDPKVYGGLEWHLTKQVVKAPIASKQILSIPIEDNKEQLLDIFKVKNERLIPLYDLHPGKLSPAHKSYGLMRVSLKKKIHAMLDFLPKNMGIAIFEAYSPPEVQERYFNNKVDELLKSGLKKPEALVEASKWVSPPDIIPVHCTGAAVDLTLFEIKEDGTKQLVDMGVFGVIFGENPHPQTLAQNVSKLQQSNRRLLLRAASAAGLVNYGFEWWHFSYGDRAWASVRQADHAIYGLVK